MLYSNLLGSTVEVERRVLTVRSVEPAMGSQLHICFASCCEGMGGCQGNTHCYAVGMLNQKEILDTSNLSLSQHFFKVITSRFVTLLLLGFY